MDEDRRRPPALINSTKETTAFATEDTEVIKGRNDAHFILFSVPSVSSVAKYLMFL